MHYVKCPTSRAPFHCVVTAAPALSPSTPNCTMAGKSWDKRSIISNSLVSKRVTSLGVQSIDTQKSVLKTEKYNQVHQIVHDYMCTSVATSAAEHALQINLQSHRMTASRDQHYPISHLTLLTCYYLHSNSNQQTGF